MRPCFFIALFFTASTTFAEPTDSSLIPKLPPKATPGFAVLGGLGLLPVSTARLNYAGWDSPQSNGGIMQNRLTLQLPVFQNDSDQFSLSLGGSSLHFGDPEVLSGGTPVPATLWKIEFGASFSRKLDDEKLEGMRLSIGSASDHPFDGLRVTTLGASAFYSWAESEKSRWMITLLFSNNNPILNYIPIPGFIYLYQNETFIGMFGFPFTSVIWMPVRPWSFMLSFFGPTLNSEINYGSPRVVQVYTGYSWLQQSYLRKDRPDEKLRIYFDEMHVPIGVRFPLGGLKSDLSTGYAFHRSIYEGSHYAKKDGGNIDLGSSWYMALSLGIDL